MIVLDKKNFIQGILKKITVCPKLLHDAVKCRKISRVILHMRLTQKPPSDLYFHLGMSKHA